MCNDLILTVEKCKMKPLALVLEKGVIKPRVISFYRLFMVAVIVLFGRPADVNIPKVGEILSEESFHYPLNWYFREQSGLLEGMLGEKVTRVKYQ